MAEFPRAAEICENLRYALGMKVVKLHFISTPKTVNRMQPLE